MFGIRGCAAQMGHFSGKKTLNMGMVLCWKTPQHGSYFAKIAKNYPVSGPFL